MTKVVAVLGTATEVGKTWMTAALASELRSRDFSVAARKPAQSFDPADPSPTDAVVLGAATHEPPTVVCPTQRWYPTPMAPPMAAAALGRTVPMLGELVAETAFPAVDITFVETAGGVRSPIASDGDCLDFVRALHPDVIVLCADAGLGTINSVRLCLTAIHSPTVITFLNRFDGHTPLHALNRNWLRDTDGYAIATSIRELADHIANHLFGGEHSNS